VANCAEENLSELKFYLDRMREAALRQLQSIVTDPRTSPEKAFELLQQISKEHRAIAGVIDSSVLNGVDKALRQVCPDDWQ